MISLGVVGQLTHEDLIIPSIPVSGSAFSYFATNLDGTDVLSRGAALTGLSNGKTGLTSYWIKTSHVASAGLIANNSLNFHVSIRGDGTPQVRGSNSSGTGILDLQCNTAITDGNWHHIAASWDLGNAKAQLFVDGANVSIVFTDTNDVINYVDASTPNFFVSSGGALGSLTGCLSEVWFNTEFLDLTVSSNLQKFRSSGGKPVNLGANGNVPTTNQPLIYLPNSFASFQTNVGSGGNFSLSGDTLTACSTLE